MIKRPMTDEEFISICAEGDIAKAVLTSTLETNTVALL